MHSDELTLSLNRGKTPKTAQRLVGDNLCKNTVFLIHRQYGKTDFVANIIATKLFMDNIQNPNAILYGPTLATIKKYYLPHFDDMLAIYKPKYDGIENVYSWMKSVDKHGRKSVCRVYMGGANEQTKSNRGGTGHILAGDEVGDWAEDYIDSVFNPMAFVHDCVKMYTGTPRGPNHFKDLYEKAKEQMDKGNKDWYALKWTIEDSLRAGEVSQKQFDEWQKLYSGPKQWRWDTEFMLDFDAATPGRVFAKYVTEAKRQNKVGYYTPNNAHNVETIWDLGVNGTVCLFRHRVGNKHIYFKCFKEVEHCNYLKFIQKEILPYIFNNNLNVTRNILPHDAKREEHVSEENRFTIAQRLLPGVCVALKPFRRKDEAIDKTCRTFYRCFFDEVGCFDFLRDLSLVQYTGTDFKKTDESVKYTHSADTFVLAENYGEHAEFAGESLYSESKGVLSQGNKLEDAFELWCRQMRHQGNEQRLYDGLKKQKITWGV